MAGASLIYILEDDENIRELIAYTLTSAGFDARTFETSDAFFRGLSEARPDLAILDIMLPAPSALDGTGVLSRMKTDGNHKDIPVIFVTAKTQEIEKARGLDLGADDYIAKPFGVLELIARVKAVLRRSGKNPAPEEVYAYKDLTVDLKSKQILKGGVPVKLTFKEFELFTYLFRNRGIVISRDQLLEKVWGEAYYGETRTVDVHIRSLRQKLSDNADNPRYISTIRGFGYKMLKQGE